MSCSVAIGIGTALFVLAIILFFSVYLPYLKSCPNNCSNNGTCVNGKCQCDSSHTGEDCSSVKMGYSYKANESIKCPVSLDNKVCSGNGRCDSNRGLCKCRPGFIGPDCSVMGFSPTFSCASNNGKECSGHGNCNGTTGICDCNDGYSGDACDRNRTESRAELITKNIQNRIPPSNRDLIGRMAKYIPPLIDKYCTNTGNQDKIAANIAKQLIRNPPISVPSGPDALTILTKNIIRGCGDANDLINQSAFNTAPYPIEDGFPVFYLPYSPY